MQLARLSPEQGRIFKVLPELAQRLCIRLDVMKQPRKRYDELLALANQAFYTGDPFQLWQAGPCLVGLNVVQPWWACASVLSEEFIIRYKPGNFADTITEALGRKPEVPAKFAGIEDLPKRVEVVPADTDRIKQIISQACA